MNDRDHAEGARNNRDRTKVTMQRKDCAEGGGMRNFAEKGVGRCRGTRNTESTQNGDEWARDGTK